jgi:hypothetical protein
MVCKECGQLYFFEFIEEVDFISADKIYCTYIPVKSKEEADQLSKSSSFEFLQLFSIRYDTKENVPRDQDTEILVNKPRQEIMDRVVSHCSALDLLFEQQNWPNKRVPEDKFPYLAMYQENNIEGYRKTIDNLRRLGREPNCDESEYWGQLESDFEHIHLS